jgi:membrane protein implicated in regulation of membrane protease activity
MPSWGWVVIGTLLFCAELFAIDAQFFLVFIGAGAILVGVVGLLGLELPVWGQWLLFAVISVGAMVAFRRRLYNKIRGGIPEMKDDFVGATVTLNEVLQPGGRCRTDFRGTTWTALNVGDAPISSGASAVIAEMDGLILKVRAA